MNRQRVLLMAGLAVSVALGSVAAVLSQAPSTPAPPRPADSTLQTRPAAVTPRFEAVAETRLLMEGLALPNYRSLEKMLKQKPADDDAWAFARGQAILIAETGNLLMLRPPRNQGRDAWMQRAMDLRQAAATVARAAGSRDLDASRKAFITMTGMCNRCHETFRVRARIGPAGKEVERDAE
jgi:hypothetical protein